MANRAKNRGLVYLRRSSDRQETSMRAQIDWAAAEARKLTIRMVALTCEDFAWAGLIELNVEVMLEPADEELALEALADFLWMNRHLGKPQARPVRPARRRD